MDGDEQLAKHAEAARAVDARAVDAQAAAAPARDMLAEWRAALAQLERHLRLVDRRVNQAFALVFIVLLPFIVRDVPKMMDSALGWAALGFMVLIPTALAIYYLRERALPPDMRQAKQAANVELQYGALVAQARIADVAQRLVSGEIDGNEMLPYLHWFSRWAYPRLRHPTKAVLLRRVGNNLKWYTGPPREYVPVWTLATLTFCAFVIISAVEWVTSAGTSHAGIVPMFFVFLMGGKPPLYGVEGWALVLHLREAWLGKDDTAQNGASAAAFEPAEAKLRRQMALVLNQAEQDLLTQPTLLGMLLAVIGSVLCVPSLSFWAFGIFIVLTYIIADSRSPQRRRAYRQRVRSRLEDSSIAQRLAAGDYEVEAIRRYVPRPLRFWLDLAGPPPAYAGQLRRSLWLMAYNLDWYLKPPATLIRPCWITVGVAFLLGLAALAWLIVASLLGTAIATPDWLNVNWKLALLNVPIVAALLTPAIAYSMNVAVWADELLAYLRRRMTAEE
jgi:hypothetical protein